MSRLAQRYFELQEQAEFYGMDMDFETLEFIPKVEVKPDPEWLRKWKNREEDFNTYMDMDWSEHER